MSHRETTTAVLAAASYYLDPFRILLSAMVAAEGGREAFIRAIQCSMPETATFEEALARACKTIRGLALSYQLDRDTTLLVAVRRMDADPWTNEDGPRVLTVTDAFVDYVAARWAPLGAANDPKDLNRNWPINVKALLRRIAQEAGDDAAT